MDWSATTRGLAAGGAVLLAMLVFAVLLTRDLAAAVVAVGRYSPIAMLVGGAVAGASSEARAQRTPRNERTPTEGGVSSEAEWNEASERASGEAVNSEARAQRTPRNERTPTDGDASGGLVVGAVLGAIPAGIVGLGLVLAAQSEGSVSLAGIVLAAVIVIAAVGVSSLIGGAGDAVYRTLGGRLGL